MSHHYSACEAGCCEDVERLTRERDEAIAALNYANAQIRWPLTRRRTPPNGAERDEARRHWDAAEFERDEARALLRGGWAGPSRYVGTLGDYIDVQVPTRVCST